MNYRVFLICIFFVHFVASMQIELCNKNLNPKLIEAVRERDIEKIKELVQSKDFSPDQKDKDGHSLLWYVTAPYINKEIYPLAREYLRLQCYDGSKHDKKQCIQQALAAERTPEVVRMLLQRGLSPNETYKLLTTVVFYDGVAWLSEKHSKIYDISWPTFWKSFFSESRYLILRELLEHGVDPNLANKDGNTLCHYIAYDEYPNNVPYKKSFPKIVKLLYEFGADFGKKNNEGLTAFHIEAQNKTKAEIAEIVLPTREEKKSILTLLLINNAFKKTKNNLPKPVLFSIIKLFFPLAMKFPLLDPKRIRTHKELLQITDNNGKTAQDIAREKHSNHMDQIIKYGYFDGIRLRTWGGGTGYWDWSGFLDPSRYA